MVRPFRLLLLFFSAVAAPPVVFAEELPAVVMQVQPVGRILADFKTTARLIGGEPMVKQFEEAISKELGDKGFDGLDLNKPIVGYSHFDAAMNQEKTSETPMVLVAPITSEGAFLAFLKRTGSQVNAVDGKKGLYEVIPKKREPQADEPPAEEPKGPSYLRIHNGYAYGGMVPLEVLDPKKLVDPAKLFIAEETGLMSTRVYFDRIPEEIRKKSLQDVKQAVEELKNTPIPPEFEGLGKRSLELLQQMAVRYLSQVPEAKEGIVRIGLNTMTGDASFEFALTGEKGTSLAKDIAERGPATNRFATMFNQETAFGQTFTAPLFNQEIREILALAIEEGSRQLKPGVEEKFHPVFHAAMEGAAATVRSGELDFALVLNGPDKNKHFTAIAGLSFNNAQTLEKELVRLFEKEAPSEAKDIITLNAAKVGDVNIHLAKIPPGSLPPNSEGLGESPSVALAFTKLGILVAVGEDPIASLKPLVNAKPQQARSFEILLNPKRMVAMMEASGSNEEAEEFRKSLGNRDELIPMFFLSLDGGKELNLKFGMNVKLFGTALKQLSTDAAVPPVPDAPEKP
jgi:hypothetical protein